LETAGAQYTLGPGGGFVFGTARSERAQVSRVNLSSAIPSTPLFTPTSASGTYMLALCLWIQTSSNAIPVPTVTASVSYSNGTLVSDSTMALPFSSITQKDCKVISQHVVSGTDVKYSTTITGTVGSGAYGLDIVETQVQ
jgi:hypothetical protein